MHIKIKVYTVSQDMFPSLDLTQVFPNLNLNNNNRNIHNNILFIKWEVKINSMLVQLTKV